MARTPLMRQLQQAVSIAAEAGTTEATVNEVRANRHSRREFIRRAGLLGAGAGVLALGGGVATAAASPAVVAPDSRRVDTTVVIVGAGLAGLSAAYRLKRHGIGATILEGSNRVGGRCLTARGKFAQGQIVERGGELIDTGHTAIRRLARELGLELDDVLRAEPTGSMELYHFAGTAYTVDHAVADFAQVYPALQDDANAAGYPTLYNSFTAAGKLLDNMSVRDWINSRVPGGINSMLGRLLDVAYTIEYGAETSDQSSLNLVYLLSGSLETELDIFGASDERFKVRGGNDLIVQRLAANLGSQIVTDAKLTSIRTNDDGRVTLGVDGVPGRQLVADHVIVAIPFTTLRHVNFARAGFNAVKTKAIRQLQLGSNTKLQLQFTDRHWKRFDNNGGTYADTGYQATWEATRAQHGDAGILVDYTGGQIASALVGADPAVAAQQFLAQIEPVLPGITQKWNGKVTLDAWRANPWTNGAYSYWRVGEYTSFAGAERERSGNIHFAGEHTSIDFQGFLNGAVDTGLAAAQEILADLHVPAA